MSLNIYADIREIFAELRIAGSDGSYSFIRVPNRKDQMLQGLVEAIKLSGTDSFQDCIIHIRSDLSETQLRERWLPAMGLICTEGFQNILEVEQQERSQVFTLKAQKEKPLIAKDFCFGVSERVNYKGEVTKPLDKAEIQTIASKLKLLGVTDVIVSLLYSKKNPKHEQELKEELQKENINVFCSHQFDGTSYQRTISAIKELVQFKTQQEIKEKLTAIGFKAENILKAKLSRQHVYVYESKIICDDMILPLSPLSAVTVDQSGVPIIKFGSIASEPGPVAFGKGVEITCLDILFYKHQLQYADTLKRIKIDLPRIKKYLLLYAQQMRTDLDTAVERFLYLFHELVHIEMQDVVNPETTIYGELAPFVLPKFKNKIKNETYVTQTGQLLQ